jgi:hypothetical protein
MTARNAVSLRQLKDALLGVERKVFEFIMTNDLVIIRNSLKLSKAWVYNLMESVLLRSENARRLCPNGIRAGSES